MKTGTTFIATIMGKANLWKIKLLPIKIGWIVRNKTKIKTTPSVSKNPVVSSIFQYRNLIFFNLLIKGLLSDWSDPYQNLTEIQGEKSCFF